MSRKYHSPNHCYLLGKLKYVESALARREGDYEKAKELLDDSVEVRESRIWWYRANQQTDLVFDNLN